MTSEEALLPLQDENEGELFTNEVPTSTTTAAAPVLLSSNLTNNETEDQLTIAEDLSNFTLTNVSTTTDTTTVEVNKMLPITTTSPTTLPPILNTTTTITTDKIESIFDENNNTNNNMPVLGSTTKATIHVGDGMDIDDDAVVLQKALSEVTLLAKTHNKLILVSHTF